MPGKAFRIVYRFARQHDNLITIDQARGLGVSAATLRAMHRRGSVRRVYRGVFRLTDEDASFPQQLQASRLWTRRDDAVLSHSTALLVYGVTSWLGTHIHVTVPVGARIRRVTPEHMLIHHSTLGATDILDVEGLKCTTPERSIWDEHRLGRRPVETRQFIRRAVADRLISRDSANDLTLALFGPGHSWEEP